MIDTLHKHRETKFVVNYEAGSEFIEIYFDGQKNRTLVSAADLRDLGNLLISIADQADNDVELAPEE